MTNQFALHLSECHASTGRFDIDAAVWIDGRVVDQPYYINLPELIRSIHVPGDYEIFVCGCGSAGCAGTTAVRVSHDGDLIRWEWSLPVCDGTQEGDHEAPFPTTPVAFAFEREQMIDAITSFVAAARDLIGSNVDRYDWPVFGFTTADLIALDPRKPYYTSRGNQGHRTRKS